MDNTIIINGIKRQIGQLMIQVGTKQIREAISDFTSIEGDYATFRKPLLGLPVTQLDLKYYFTSFENWEKIIATINPILKEFKWKSESFDCDKRAFLVTALVALFFDINTVRPMYCGVYGATDGNFNFDHYANVFVDSNGNAYLWDVDQCGKITKITSQYPIIDSKKYLLKAVK